MMTKKKPREAEPLSLEARPTHRHCDYVGSVQTHLAKHAPALATSRTRPRTYPSSEVYALVNKRIDRYRIFFDALLRLGFTEQIG